MATKIIQTRIKNKIDNLEAWLSTDKILLDGEIAVVRVPTGDTYTNPITNKEEPVVELLMKVGNGSATFDKLPWLSAKASDVYDWAKSENLEDVAVKATVDNAEYTFSLTEWLRIIMENYTAVSTDHYEFRAEVADKLDVDKVSTAISSAINSLGSNTVGSGNFVKNVTQANGTVTVTKGNIVEADLPQLSASKINVDASAIVDPDAPAEPQGGQTLDVWLDSYSAAVAALESRNPGHTDAQINTLITNKINALDYSSSTSGTATDTFVSAVTQTNGKIEVTKAKIQSGTASTAGIVKLGATGGAATYDAVSDLTDRVEDAESDIVELKTAVAGGVHFIGVTSTPIEDGSTTQSVKINNTDTAVAQGDVVIYLEKEFIWTGTTSGWKELGDLSRVGDLETRIDNLTYTDPNYVAGKAVVKVTQDAGKIAVTHANVKTDYVDHTTGTGSAASTKTLKNVLNTFEEDIADHESRVGAVEGALTGVTTVTGYVSSVLDGLDASDPTASNSTASAFIDTIKQENGKITATKKKLPSASASVAGIAKLGATGGAATFDAVDTLTDRVENAEAAIGSLNGIIVDAAHFRGEVTTPANLSTAADTKTVTISGSSYSAVKGDIVSQGTKTFIWSGSTWIELGDAARIKAVEDTIAGLDVTDTAQTNKFVTAVSQTNGKISVSRDVIKSTQIKHGDSSTVNAAITGLDSRILANENKLTSVTTVPAYVSGELGKLTGTSSGDGSIVVSVSQANGKITEVRGNITETMLPKIGAGKIITKAATGDTSEETLTTKLSAVDADITELKARQVGHTDAAINSLISNNLSGLSLTDPTASGATSTTFISNIAQTKGKISATKKTLPTASDTVAGITKLGATGAAAKHDDLVALTGRVEDAEADIEDLQAAIAGGVHFIGVTTTAITDGNTTKTVVISSQNKDASTGDVVLYGEKEFIWTGTAWKELGDLTRVGTLEQTINGLNATYNTSNSGKFVSKVTQSKGQVAVEYTALSASHIGYGDSDAKTALDNLDSRIYGAEQKLSTVTNNVGASITAALEGLDYSSPSAASTTSTTFIDTVKQTNGVISATKKTLPTASTSAKGIVQLGVSGGAAAHNDFSTVRDTVNNTLTPAIADIEAKYVRFNTSDNKLYAMGTTGLEEIIFDCGGADVETPAAASYGMRMTTPAVSSGSDGVFEPDGSVSDFVGVEINGTPVPEANYTIE